MYDSNTYLILKLIAADSKSYPSDIHIFIEFNQHPVIGGSLPVMLLFISFSPFRELITRVQQIAHGNKFVRAIALVRKFEVRTR